MGTADFLDDLDTVVARYEAGEFSTQIASDYGVTSKTVRKYLRLRGVTIRKRGHGIDGPTKRRLTDQQERQAGLDYRDGATLREVAVKYGMSKSGMKWVLDRAGVSRRTAHETLRQRSPSRKTNSQGYVLVRVPPDEPYCPTRYRGDFVLEHRLVMSRAVGRAVLPAETVHHKNGIRDDNRLENLELHVGHHGSSQCFRCRDCGSTNVAAVGLKDAA